MKLYDLFGYDLIGTGGATYTANSINTNPSLVFNGTNDYFTSPDISSGLTATEVFIVGQRNADPPASDPLTGFWKYGSAGTDNHVPYSDGTIYDDFGSSARKTVGNPTTSLASLFLYNISSASANFTARLNGTQIFNTGTNTFGLKSAPLLGKSVGAYYYSGKFGAFIILNAVATSGQRSAIQTYLNNRYIIY